MLKAWSWALKPSTSGSTYERKTGFYILTCKRIYKVVTFGQSFLASSGVFMAAAGGQLIEGWVYLINLLAILLAILCFFYFFFFLFTQVVQAG